MNTDSGKGGIYQIGQQFYYVEICFYNGILDPVFIPMEFVEDLSIKENLNQWWSSGFLTLNNDFQFLEKGSVIKSKTGEKQYLKNLISDRPDGRNKFCIRIHPVNPNNKSENDFILENINDFELCFDMVVWDVQDNPTENSEKKFKTYYLWDERYQLFLERNIEFSTALLAKEIFNIETITSESDRQLNPNLALMGILTKAGLYPDDTAIKIGYLKNGSIDKPDQDAVSIDNDNWNTGDENNNIFYTSYADTNVVDDINNILPLCCDENGFPVVLSLGRSTDDKKFKLMSLKKYFDESSENQKERMIFFDTKVSPIDNETWMSRGPNFEDNGEVLKNFTSGIASKITSYQFCPMSNIDDKNLLTSPQHYFDFSTGEFNILFKQNTINDFEGKVNEMVSGLHNLSSGKNGQVLLKINKLKQQNSSIKNIFSAVKEIPKNLPQIQMLKDFVFLNQALAFQTYGLTFRKPGNFFTLESIHSDDKQNNFWDKFLGQWMMVEIEHRFNNNTYSNLIIANKVDSSSKIYETKDEKYIA